MPTGDPFDELSGDPSLGPAAGDARDDWRLEEEVYARAAAQRWAHGRTIIDVATEWLHRGDAIAIQLDQISFTGTIVDVGNDFITLLTGDADVDLPVTARISGVPRGGDPRLSSPLILRVVERARAGGRRATGTAANFRARLLEHEADEAEVVVGSLLLREEVKGRLTVGRDHVAVCSGEDGETYLPLAWVGWVRRSRD